MKGLAKRVLVVVAAGWIFMGAMGAFAAEAVGMGSALLGTGYNSTSQVSLSIGSLDYQFSAVGAGNISADMIANRFSGISIPEFQGTGIPNIPGTGLWVPNFPIFERLSFESHSSASGQFNFNVSYSYRGQEPPWGLVSSPFGQLP